MSPCAPFSRLTLRRRGAGLWAYRRQGYHRARRPSAQHQGHQRQSGDARLCSSSRSASRRARFSALRTLRGPSTVVFWTEFRDPTRARRHLLHQVRRLQSRAHPAALPPVMTTRGEIDGRGWACSIGAGMLCARRAFSPSFDLHAAHGRPDGINPDDGRDHPRVYCTRASGAHGQAWRAAPSAYSGDRRSWATTPERPIRALSRPATLQCGWSSSTGGHQAIREVDSGRIRDHGRRAVELAASDMLARLRR